MSHAARRNFSSNAYSVTCGPLYNFEEETRYLVFEIAIDMERVVYTTNTVIHIHMCPRSLS
jgi:hypothetical protein